MLTKKEERILRLIQDGALRNRRIAALLILSAALICGTIIFIRKGGSEIKQIQDKYVAVADRVVSIHTTTALETKLKNDLLHFLRIQETTASASMSVVMYLIVSLFLIAYSSLCFLIIITGNRDNLIKKVVDSSAPKLDK